MRIGIDMMGVQSPGSRGRGVGRLGRGLVEHLLALDTSSRYVLYSHNGYPTEAFPSAPNAAMRFLHRDPARGETELAHVMDRLARDNPDDLDLLLLLNPFELDDAYGLPAKPLNGLRLAAFVHDVIPFLFQEQYLKPEAYGRRMYRHLERLRQYDLLLANSEATRTDLLSILNLPPNRVVTVGAAADRRDFGPDRSIPMPPASRGILEGLGITRPFVYCLGGIDHATDRKNWQGLIAGFALLPPKVLATHQLVLTCSLTASDQRMVHERASAHGIGHRFITTGLIPDEAIRVLYQRCAVFCFPSLYEGFGLPLLEAMHCGAPVVAGNNSSQVEVVGDAGLLVNASDPADIAANLSRILTDPDLAESLRIRGQERAAGFSWERTAEATYRALKRPSRRLRADLGQSVRPRLAIFSPLPPKCSGIADYTARLIHELKGRYAIDLYHDAGYVPEPALADPEFGAYDHRLFDLRARRVDYRGIVYHMGNSRYHRDIYETMDRHPGVVTLHDFCLSGFHAWYSQQPGIGRAHFERELANFAPHRFAEFAPQLPDWEREPGGIQEACAQRGLYLNRGLFERAGRVIVHSPWCVDQVRELFPEHLAKMAVVRMGATIREISPDERRSIRARFELPQAALIVASFGILHLTKMNVQALDAFSGVARAVPSALFVFVGEDLMFGQARARAEELGLLDRVRFLGRQSGADFAALIAAADLGVNLRLPPTNGETSAALMDMLGRGVPTIVTDVGTFSGYPDSAVRKIRWDGDGPDRLAATMLSLAIDREEREALGRTAISHAREFHSWEATAAGYVAVIEDHHAERSRSGGGRHHPQGQATKRTYAC